MAECKHMDFKANVKVGRLTAAENSDVVVWFDAEVTIECAECGIPFEFMGLPMGLSPLEPCCSVTGVEARMPIKPKGEIMPKREDLIGFQLHRTT